jgi:RNA polymerase sigma factor (sigma-70 family)
VNRRAPTRELEALYRARYPQFLRVATAIAGDEASGHDAVQEGFARALKAVRTYRGSGTLEAWIWPIVINAARAMRSPPRQAVAATAAKHENGHDADGAVRALVAALPERQRLALFLRYYADLDYEAIAEALGVKAGTVAATLHAAHAALRRQLLEVER